MRLINTVTHQLVSCDDNELPSYAILSHTWGPPDEEVSFQDVYAATTGSQADLKSLSWKKKPGWIKIERACAQALKSGYPYIWVDTCCIDKSSSAELQEGINSMFRWYEGAATCLAYLSDVPANCDPEAEDSFFRSARWFTRGWTLQELLAPQEVVFYDGDWNCLGDKTSLSTVIQEISGIESRYIDADAFFFANWGSSAYERLSEASVAQRMSWMSRRQTTRVEDMAYCLLGIFDIHMPMLYGEGRKAFKRLQEEIMKESDDASLLSWRYKNSGHDYFGEDSILSPSPAAFKNCHSLVTIELPNFPRPSFSMTQRGLVLTMPTKQDQNHGNILYAILNCKNSQPMLPPDQLDSVLVLPLISVRAYDSPTSLKNHDEYLRLHWCMPSIVSTEFIKGAITRTIVIRRPSRLMEAMKDLPGVLRPIKGGKLMGIYPPQPGNIFFGTNFVSLGTSLDKQHETNIHQSNCVETSVVLPRDGSEKHKSGQSSLRMCLVKVSNDMILIVIAFQIKNLGEESEVLDILSSRAFKMPAVEFCLEPLHNLAFNNDYTGLREFSAVDREEGKFFKITEDDDQFLFLRTEDAEYVGKPMTEIEIFVQNHY